MLADDVYFHFKLEIMFRLPDKNKKILIRVTFNHLRLKNKYCLLRQKTIPRVNLPYGLLHGGYELLFYWFAVIPCIH